MSWWKILKWCCPLDLADDVSIKCQVEQCFTAFPQLVLPKITLRTRLPVKANVGFSLEPQRWANTHITGHRALMPLAHLFFFRGGLQLPNLSHLNQEEKDVKYTSHTGCHFLYHFCTDNPSVRGSCGMGCLWSAHKEGGPIPL